VRTLSDASILVLSTNIHIIYIIKYPHSNQFQTLF